MLDYIAILYCERKRGKKSRRRKSRKGGVIGYAGKGGRTRRKEKLKRTLREPLKSEGS